MNRLNPGSNFESGSMTVTSRIATNAMSAMKNVASPIYARARKIDNSPSRSKTTSSIWPRGDCRLYRRATPPSSPSMIWERARSARPSTRCPPATTSAAINPMIHPMVESWFGDRPSFSCTKRIGKLRMVSESEAMPDPHHDRNQDRTDDARPDLFLRIGVPSENSLRRPCAERIERALLVAHHVVQQKVRREKERRDVRPQVHRERDDPHQRHRLLQGRAPVIMLLVLLAVFFQVERQFDRVIDEIDAISERVGQHDVFSLQAENLHSDGGEEQMRKNRHTTLLTTGCLTLSDVSRMNSRPSMIQKNSRMRITTPR